MFTYYVRKSGNDANSGLTPGDAWLTIGQANSVVAAGDTVYVGSGDYSAELISPENTTSGVWQYWIADKKGLYTGDAAGDIKVKGFQDHGSGLGNEIYNVEVVGFYFVRTKDVGGTVITNSQYSEYIAVKNCILDHYMHFSCGGGDGYYYIYNNVINLQGLDGTTLYISFGRHDIFIYNNTIYCGNQPIQIHEYSFGAVVKIKNNIFIKPVGLDDYLCFYRIYDTAHWEIDYNDYLYRDDKIVKATYAGGNLTTYATLSDWQVTGFDVTSIDSDPLFRADKYHLTFSSPCINMGTDLSAFLTDDIDLDLRTLPFDIGADEFSPTSFSGSITGDAYILPHSTANPLLFEVVQFTIQNATQEYREPKLKHVCNHTLFSGTYTLTTCPRCLGTGYYYDIKIDELGLVEQVFDEEKLMQELEKITLTPIGDNIFHTGYGTLLHKAHSGLASREMREVDLKQSIINAVFYLKQLQELEISDDSLFSPQEVINSIKKIEVYEDAADPTFIGYTVHILTSSGGTTVVKGTIT